MENIPFLDINLIDELLAEFWPMVMDKLSDDEYAIILIRLNFLRESQFMTLSKAKKASKYDQEAFRDSLKHDLDNIDEHYAHFGVKGITIDYIINTKPSGKNIKSDFSSTNFRKKNNFPDKIIKKYTHVQMKYKLPLNMDYKS